MTTTTYRQESADPAKPKPQPLVLARHALEAAAQRHGVTTSPSMSDRALAEAIATKLSPNTYKFAGRETDAYAMKACELALASAEEAAAKPPAPAPAPVAVKEAAPVVSTAHPKANGAAGAAMVSSESARDHMIHAMVTGRGFE